MSGRIADWRWKQVHEAHMRCLDARRVMLREFAIKVAALIVAAVCLGKFGPFAAPVVIGAFFQTYRFWCALTLTTRLADRYHYFRGAYDGYMDRHEASDSNYAEAAN
jgi:hypothetical protein